MSNKELLKLMDTYQKIMFCAGIALSYFGYVMGGAFLIGVIIGLVNAL